MMVISLCAISNAQTTFDQGDLVIVGVNANNNGCSGVVAEDKVSLVSFIDITPGTVIHMTDNGWERTTANLWGDTEGFYVCTYNGPGNIPAGTAFTFTFPNAASPTCPNWTFTTTNVLNMNSGGDQLYIMQAGTWSQGTAAVHDATYTGGRFLCAFNTGTSWTSLGASTQQSGLHPSVPCVSYAVSGAASDFVRYNGPTTITNRYNWYIRITTPANWLSTDGSCANYNTNFTLTSIPLDNTYTTATWDGSTNNNWFDCTNWSTNRVPNEFTDVVIPNVSNNPIIDFTAQYSDNFQDTARCHHVTMNAEKLEIVGSPNNILVAHGDLTIDAAANSELDMSDGTFATTDGRVFLRGNWINNNTENDFKQGQSTIIFWGPNNQTITTADASNLEVFYHVTINKTAGSVTLNDNIEVGANSGDPLGERLGVFTLTNRNLITGTFSILVTNPAITGVSGGSANSFVDGNFRRQSNTVNLYDYPCGEGTRYMRAGLRTTSTNLTVMEVDAQNTGYGTYTPLEASLFDVSHLRWWDVTKISGSSNINVRLYWPGTAASEGITNVGDLVVAHWSNRDHAGAVSTQQWWNRGRSIANSSGLISDGFVEGSETETTFSPHTFGTLTNSNPLPVELISFNAACDNENVILNWSTATETNNEHFEIQGSNDGINYSTVSNYQGAGNSNSIINYQDIIVNIYRYGYFRLAQIDFNGFTTYFNPLHINCENLSFSFAAHVNNNSLQIILPDLHSSHLVLLITDLSGKTLTNKSLSLNENISIYTMELDDNLATGIYIVSLLDELNGNLYYSKVFKN